MSIIDWIVLILTLSFIVFYGVWKSRNTHNISGFLLADRKLPWYHVGLSVMATQASAITFLSGPGMAYSDGMRFLQFYFGLPLAMIVLCITFIPKFRGLNVYTAYEFLEHRFDQKTRSLTAFLFLLQRGLSTGITIYAPAIVLSTILSVDLTYTTLFMGLLVILYTVYGGTKAVSYTQVLQMSVIFSGLFIAAYMVIKLMPSDIGLVDALHIAGKLDKLQTIDLHFDINNKYNIWSGIIGGFFLQLSYFGTDQSQVGRYLTGSSVRQSRLGLIMNGLVKIPMQFLILLIGTLVFTFYQFHQPQLFFNRAEVSKIVTSPYSEEYLQLESSFAKVNAEKREKVLILAEKVKQDDKPGMEIAAQEVMRSGSEAELIRKEAQVLMKKNDPDADTNDTNFVFLGFVMDHLPVGIVGLLIAIIFLAAMGSTASGINSLASTTVVDFYKRIYKKEGTEKEYLFASRAATVLWGLFCMVVALYAGRLGNLIEAVNVLGSLFYGTILGIFLVAFYMKSVRGNSVFIAALLAECFVVISWQLELTAFLWLNVIGCLLVMLFAFLLDKIFLEKQKLEEQRQSDLN